MKILEKNEIVPKKILIKIKNKVNFLNYKKNIYISILVKLLKII